MTKKTWMTCRIRTGKEKTNVVVKSASIVWPAGRCDRVRKMIVHDVVGDVGDDGQVKKKKKKKKIDRQEKFFKPLCVANVSGPRLICQALLVLQHPLRFFFFSSSSTFSLW
eukprot:Rmarinus@m.29644